MKGSCPFVNLGHWGGRVRSGEHSHSGEECHGQGLLPIKKSQWRLLKNVSQGALIRRPVHRGVWVRNADMHVSTLAPG